MNSNEFDILTEIQNFQFGQNRVRVIFSDNTIWFVAGDIGKALGLADFRTSVKLLDEDDRHTMPVTDSLGRIQDTIVVNESGLYNLIFQSRKEEAKQFKKWVTADVLPAIRKTGKYEIANVKNLSEEERRLVIRQQIKDHNPRLSAEAQKAGVGNSGDAQKDNREFAIFHNKGYQGLYGGLGKKQIARKKGLSEKANILDFMNSTELAANFFRVTQTEERLKNDNIRQKEEAYRTHYIVGAEVRKAMIAISGIKPEEIPFVDDIKKIQMVEKDKPFDKIEIDISTQLWSVALLIASTKPAGIITTKELIAEIPKYIHIPDKYLEKSGTRQEPKYIQIVRNIKSNKQNKTSIFSKGYAVEVRGGFQITKEGFNIVKELFKSFL